MTVLSSEPLAHVKATKEEKSFYDSLLVEDYDDYKENEQGQDMWNNIAATLAEVLENKPPRKVRTPDKDREIRKMQWEELYRQKSDDDFVDKMRISRTTFNVILNNMLNQLVPPTN